MRLSQLFTKTQRQVPVEEKSINAQLLIKGGFIDKLMAGVYTYLPLGWLVYKKIENIIREEMQALGGQEILMPALTPKENWQVTRRWESFDALFRFKGADNKDYALGATHEEVISPLVKKYVNSYKDLPLYIFQIQDKFRNEARAKSGLLRCREFVMKDLYSFHNQENDLADYYEKVKKSYQKIFSLCGLAQQTYLTLASGGSFSKYSHEFQTVTENGEDIIYVCAKCRQAINHELISQVKKCQNCGNTDLIEKKAVEVGNIFKLGDKYSQPFNLNFTDQDGKQKPIIMGCYGIGLGRLLGTIVEVKHDKNGIIWPLSVAPLVFHLICLGADNKTRRQADHVYDQLTSQGLEVLFDDRQAVTAGEKFIDADLIGLPYRLVVSAKTQKKLEVKPRTSQEIRIVDLKAITKLVK